MAKEKKRSATKLFVALIILVVFLAAGGFLASQFLAFKKEKKADQALENISLKVEIVNFTNEKLPNVHAGLVRLNYKIRLIDKEITRISLMEEAFPQQKKIILSEKKEWEKTRKAIAAALSKLENEVEALYVMATINSKKGLEQIENKRAELLKTIEDTLESTQVWTDRLAAPEEKTFTGMLKEKFITRPMQKYFQ